MNAVDPLVPLRLASVGDRPRAAWAEGLWIRAPQSLFERAGWRRLVAANGDLNVPAEPAPIEERDVAAVRERRAFTDSAPASARLPINYRVVPGWARSLVARAIGEWNRRHVARWGTFPAWPIDLSADALRDLAHDAPEPATRRTPVVLTHDIDSAEGLTNLVTKFLPAEESLGARSTNYVVPCAWRLDRGLMREVMARGHEIGVHGYDHSNTTPFAAAEERARRLAREFADQYGARGYRAPSLLRTRALLRDVASRYTYDSSIPTAGGLFPTPNNGCATARPFTVENVLELPISLPRDGMMKFLGYKPDEILRYWKECADLIARARGVVVLLTHCEQRFSGEPRMLDAYRRFIDFVREHSDRFAFSSPADVLGAARRRAS